MKVHTTDQYHAMRSQGNGYVTSGRGHNEHMNYTGMGKFNAYPDHMRMVRQRNSSMFHPPGYHHKNALTLITELGSESNAHGLAKIVTSSDTKRKVIWALMVIIGFTAATLQLSLLVRKYLLFQVVELSEIKDSMPVEFPAITVCNNDPFSVRKLRLLFEKPDDTELMQWLNFTQKFNFGAEHTPHLTSIRAFYENLGEEARSISHDLDDFLIHCRFNQEKCHISNFTTFFDGNYFNCFTFNGGEQGEKLLMHATGPQNGLSLILSLDNDEPPLGSYGVYNLESNILHSAGARVVVHAPNTMPSPVDHGLDIPPGYSSSIGLKANLHTRLSEPYGNCSTARLPGMDYANTFFSCLQVCKQRIIIEECKCKSSALPDGPFGKNVSFCGAIPNWKNILAGRGGYKPGDRVPVTSFACEDRKMKELSNDRAYETSCQCYQPCGETFYQKAVSLSYWPLEFYQLYALQLFYGSDIKQSFMHEAYTLLNELSNISGLMKERNDTRAEDIIKESLTLTEKEKGQRASNLIRQNLLRLNVYMEDLSVVEYRQLPAYGLADLFADIGGTLGLWMGISVLTIMELVELIIRLFFLLFNSETKPPNFQDEEQEYVASNGMLANHLHSGHGPGHHTGQGHDMNEKEFVDASGFDFKMHTETMA
ncbi:FMRFamide-activated amiloride-sensitive sodium channel-like [Littorina saxatilis]|uniref:FMRFamide-activated amiloride-sensitive sodium channel-like n=1 Tax=Littorina saxatilis TaxID=31220 RepID=UPI0038B544E9